MRNEIQTPSCGKERNARKKRCRITPYESQNEKAKMNPEWLQDGANNYRITTELF